MTIEELNAAAVRFRDRADLATRWASTDFAAELNLAANICSALASLRFRLRDIIAADRGSFIAISIEEAIDEIDEMLQELK